MEGWLRYDDKVKDNASVLSPLRLELESLTDYSPCSPFIARINCFMATSFAYKLIPSNRIYQVDIKHFECVISKKLYSPCYFLLEKQWRIGNFPAKV